jgi:hypothetical protein
MVKKPNTIRVCCDIPVEWHTIIREYNSKAVRQVNLAHAFLLTVEAEVKKIKQEVE